MTFTPQPLKRPTADAIREAISPQAATILPATPTDSAELVQLTFKVTPAFAKILMSAADDKGLRHLIAQTFKGAGYPVPARDLVVTRRRRSY